MTATAMASSASSSGLGSGKVRAAVFDLDGTLYVQSPLRLMMALELGLSDTLARLTPRRQRSARAILEFRRMHESHRRFGATLPSLEDTLVAAAAERSGMTRERMAETAIEWLHTRPLKYLRYVRRSGIVNLLTFLRARGVRIGVLSDYPVDGKLRALGLDGFVDLGLCTTDPDINALKPHPRGFLVACDRLGISPAETLYIGDRPDVDAAGAAAAGLRCAIVGSHRSADGGYMPVAHFQELQRVLDHNC